MPMTDRGAVARAWGVADRYHDALGRFVEAPATTIDLILQSMGATSDGPPAAPVVVTHPHDRAEIAGPATLVTEEGDERRVADRLDPDLPLGYHWLHPDDGAPAVRVIVSPGRCVPPPPGRAWGWAAQLYAVRSARSWGMGDLGDLAALARWSVTDLGAGFTLLNPIHAALPGLPQEPSPYFPSSRRFRSPLYLRIEDVPGAADRVDDVDRLARAGRALNGERLIDRDAVWRLKMEALEAIWGGFGGDAEFDRWRVSQGEGLEAYATFCALTEIHGRPWHSWPDHYRHPEGEAVSAFARDHPGRVAFHAWLQWLVDGQLATACSVGPVVGDLAVGFDPAGADAWAYQSVIAADLSVGAPPDPFNTAGQDWGIRPFDPWRLRAAGYQPFVDTVRAGLHAGGGIRIDHVMGLFRQFWVPGGVGPAAGTYVRYPASELLDIVALESHRAAAFVVGEDLGTVEEGVREELADRGVLSYRLLWFDREPQRWPEQSMGAVTTHDLPTLAGMWTGSDLRAQRDIGLAPNAAAADEARASVEHVTGKGPGDSHDDVVTATYEVLGRSPCRLVAATLEDALGVEERPNMPGTIDEWPNWRLALPIPLEEIVHHPGPRRLAAAIRPPPPPG